jgi:hypothetical protein
MVAWNIRRVLAVLLAAMLVVAGTVHGVHATDMSIKMAATAKMTTATGDVPMPGGCNGCGGDDHGMSAAACFAVCGGAIAILPSVPLVAAVTLVSLPAAQAVSVAGLHGPPEPYPPRPTILT